MSVTVRADPALCQHRLVPHPAPDYVPWLPSGTNGKIRIIRRRWTMAIYRCLDCDLRSELAPRTHEVIGA